MGMVVLLVIYVTVPAVDRAWFSSRVPDAFADAQWEGEWESEQLSLLSGRLLAKLPDPVPTNQAFDVDALVYYRIWSPFRTGRAVPMKMVGFFGSDQTGGGGDADTPVVVPAHFSFKLKGGGLGPQAIDYVATSNETPTVICGGYRSEKPYDMGLFTLRRK